MTAVSARLRIRLLAALLACGGCVVAAGCGEPKTVPGQIVGGHSAGQAVGAALDAAQEKSGDQALASSADGDSTSSAADASIPSEVAKAGSEATDDRRTDAVVLPKETRGAPVVTETQLSKDRTFAVEGPGNAVRIAYDDVDLLKILKMDPVTPDCVDKMPSWLKGLNGKRVRIRGFMKPGLLMTGIPQFMLVRDTGLCCFGPKGKVYDMMAVTLKEGTTTDYIELRPFDVVGNFRIELLQDEDEGVIFGLYYIDDAEIIRK